MSVDEIPLDFYFISHCKKKSKCFLSTKKIKKILLPSGGGPHAQAAEIYAGDLAKAMDGSLTAIRVVTDASLSEEEQLEIDAKLINTKTRIEEKCGLKVITKLINHPRIEAAIIDESLAHDTVFIGATRKSMYHDVLFGTIPETLAKELNTNIIIVKHHLPVDAVWDQVVGKRND